MIKRYINALGGGGSGGTPNTFFDSNTNQSDSASFDQHTAQLVGEAGAILTIQVTTYVNNNPIGRVLVNGIQFFLNQTFPVTLDGAGHGGFNARVEGNAGAGGTVVRAVFTIVGISIGTLSSPSTNGISKIF